MKLLRNLLFLIFFIPALAHAQPYQSIWDGTHKLDITSGQAAKVDGSAVTQPVSGTLTCNAGTNLNTSALATSANQTTIIGHVDGIEALLGTIDANTSNIATNTSTIIGHVDGLEGLLTTIDGDTGNIATSTATIAGAVSGTEMQVDVLTMPTTTVQATNLDIRDLSSVSDSVSVLQSTATNLKTQAEAYQGGTAVGAGNPLQVSVANTGANATAIKVDGSAVTQPVSGSVAVTSVVPGTGATNLGKPEDGGHTTGDTGVMALAVRNDTIGALATPSGDYSPLQVDSQGNLRISADSVVDSGNSTTTPLGSGGNFTGAAFDLLPYSSWSLSIFSDKASAANGLKIEWSEDGTNWDFKDSQTYLASVGNMITFGRKTRYVRLNYTNTNSAQTIFRVTAVAQRLAVRQTRKFVGNQITDQDTGQVVIAGIQGHTTAGGGAWVDVKVAPSGALTVDATGSTVDTELSAGAAASDNFANPTVPGVLNFAHWFDGSTWDRAKGDSTDGLLVNLGANNDVVAAGDVAHDNGDSGNPVKVGGKAMNAFITPVSNNDRTNFVTDLWGRQLTAQIDPAMQKCSSVNVTTSQTGTDVIGDDMTGDNWVLTSGKKIAITSAVISSYATTACRAILWFGDDGDTSFTQNTDKILLPFNTAPTTSSKPGIVFNPPTPVFNTNANRELHLTSDQNCSLDIAVCGYEW